MNPELQMLLRVAAAGLFSAALGWERESRGKSAGLRTHMLVAMAAALFSVSGILMVQNIPEPSGALRFDPLRIIQSIATGISFLGAGTIFLARGNRRVRGLTTAASIWAAAAIGVACGQGQYILAGGSTALLILVLRGLARFDTDQIQREQDGAGAWD